MEEKKIIIKDKKKITIKDKKINKIIVSKELQQEKDDLDDELRRLAME